VEGNPSNTKNGDSGSKRRPHGRGSAEDINTDVVNPVFFDGTRSEIGN
jgi:hypothetical protein